MGKIYDKRKWLIGILILAILAIIVFGVIINRQRIYTGAEVELPMGLSALETVESYLRYYGEGNANGVSSFRYQEAENLEYTQPSLWLVKDVTIENIEDVTEETDFTYSLTGSIASTDKACIRVTYTIDYYFKDDERIENYNYFLIKSSTDFLIILAPLRKCRNCLEYQAFPAFCVSEDTPHIMAYRSLIWRSKVVKP